MDTTDQTSGTMADITDQTAVTTAVTAMVTTIMADLEVETAMDTTMVLEDYWAEF